MERHRRPPQLAPGALQRNRRTPQVAPKPARRNGLQQAALPCELDGRLEVALDEGFQETVRTKEFRRLLDEMPRASERILAELQARLDRNRDA